MISSSILFIANCFFCSTENYGHCLCFHLTLNLFYLFHVSGIRMTRLQLLRSMWSWMGLQAKIYDGWLHSKVERIINITTCTLWFPLDGTFLWAYLSCGKVYRVYFSMLFILYLCIKFYLNRNETLMRTLRKGY